MWRSPAWLSLSMELCSSHSWLPRTTHCMPPKLKLSLPSVPAGKVNPRGFLSSSVICDTMYSLLFLEKAFWSKLEKREFATPPVITPDSTADLHLSLLSLPTLFFTDNSGHDNDTESVSEPTSGCSSPLMFKHVHVSTVSHHANCTFMPC